MYSWQGETPKSHTVKGLFSTVTVICAPYTYRAKFLKGSQFSLLFYILMQVW